MFDENFSIILVNSVCILLSTQFSAKYQKKYCFEGSGASLSCFLIKILCSGEKLGFRVRVLLIQNFKKCKKMAVKMADISPIRISVHMKEPCFAGYVIHSVHKHGKEKSKNRYGAEHFLLPTDALNVKKRRVIKTF